jgi:tetratricopeptide (TPR) repeat protein
MKKVKPQQTTRSVAAGASREFPWPAIACFAAFVLVWIVYGPALHGPFVFDDRYSPFTKPESSSMAFLDWISLNRPLLMATFWVNFQMGGIDPFGYHVVNVLLHAVTSVMVGLSVAKLLALAGTTGAKNTALALFGGTLFLLHPVQTESVAYVISRSETLSVLLYFSAFVLFLYRPEGPLSWPRATWITLLMGAAFSTKEHTVTLPVLLLLTDYFFNPRGIRENLRAYILFAVAAVAGAISVAAVLNTSNSAGFRIQTISPLTYAFTQCRVIWTYVRMFLLPYGLNLDPDIAPSPGLLEHGAIFGLAGLLIAVGAAWIYRKSWPLASYGWLLFLLLLAPTSSIVPILDVLAEHRLYLPFLGLILITVDGLRRITAAQATWTCIAALAICSVLTFQRSQLWGDPVLLWTDSVANSPRKARPNFSLAYAYHQKQQCLQADKYFEIAAGLGKPSANLLLDWALNDECLGRYEEGVAKLRQSDALAPGPATKATMAILYGAQQKWPEVLAALADAEKADPKYPYTYAYRGDYYEVKGDYAAAAAEYRRALAVAPWLQKAKDGLARVSSAGR